MLINSCAFNGFFFIFKSGDVDETDGLSVMKHCNHGSQFLKETLDETTNTTGIKKV